jgi:hypothetical protein
MSFSEQVKNFAVKADLLTTQVFQNSCNQISVDIAEGSPVSTGRLLGSWSPSNGTLSSYKFAGGPSAWKNVGPIFWKDDSIAAANQAAAMANLLPRIESTTKALSKKEAYYFTNDTPYIKNAEHEGWANTGAYHMRENAVLNWQLIVDSKAMELAK